MSRRIKNTISSKELLQAMGGIRDCYVKEADYAACAATRKQPHRWYVAAGMAAMLALSILLPNLNKATAYAMQSLPVIGEYFKLVTFREYRFDDGRHSADVKWNKIYADRAGMDDSEETGKQARMPRDWLFANWRRRCVCLGPRPSIWPRRSPGWAMPRSGRTRANTAWD